MATIITFPTPATRAERALEAALDQLGRSPADNAAALEMIMRLALEQQGGEAAKRATRWLVEVCHLKAG
jgi:hypothetical protein